MIIDPTDNNFTPTKRYLVQIPGTGIFHVDSFEELVIDLRPEYGQVPDPESKEGEIARHTILASLSQEFVQMYRVQLELEGAAAPPIVVESGVNYDPYTDIPIPDSTPERFVISYENLDEVLAQAGQGYLPPSPQYLLIVPAHEPDPVFQALGLAGLVEINDLQKQKN
jgi:hypothetical protein